MLKGKSVSGELWLSPHTCTVENWLTSRCALEVPRCHTDPINWSLKKFTRTPQSRARMSKARTSCLSDGKCQTWSRLWSNDSKAILKHVVCQAGNLSFERLDISLFICQSTGQRSKCPCELCPPKSGIQRDRRGECRYSLAKFLNASSTFFHHLIGHEWPCLTAAKKKNFRDVSAQQPIRFSVSSCSSSRLPMTTGCEAMKLASISASQGNLVRRYALSLLHAATALSQSYGKWRIYKWFTVYCTLITPWFNMIYLY